MQIFGEAELLSKSSGIVKLLGDAVLQMRALTRDGVKSGYWAGFVNNMKIF